MKKIFRSIVDLMTTALAASALGLVLWYPHAISIQN